MAKGDLNVLMRQDEALADTLDAQRFRTEEADRRAEVDHVISTAVD